LGALIPDSAQWVACAIGTAGTICGMIGGLADATCALGVTVVRSGDEPETLMDRIGVPAGRYRIIKGYEAGGYGKSSPELSAFCERFSIETGIPLEPVYSGKLFFAVSDLAEKGYFRRGEELVILHSGGIFR
jgi:1-aminocyclopropane-1-carboxylate deaminase